MGLFDFLRKNEIVLPNYIIIEGTSGTCDDSLFKTINVQINERTSVLRTPSEKYLLYGTTYDWESIEQYKGVDLLQPVPDFETCDGEIRSRIPLNFRNFQLVPRAVYTLSGRIFVQNNFWKNSYFNKIQDQLPVVQAFFKE